MINKVAVVGGTHGNELGGISLIRQWQKQMPGPFDFDLNLLLASPEAIAHCRRYMDQDLNRSFVPAALGNDSLQNYENQRARELYAVLKDSDFLLDLHNTTSNMGRCLILSREGALDDPLTRSLCLTLTQRHEDVRVYVMSNPPQENPYLPSVAHRDITLEVGPMAHGTLRAQSYLQTQELVLEILALLQAATQPDWQSATGELEIFEHLYNLDYPREGEVLAAMIHPQLQDHDFEALAPGEPLFMDFSGQSIAYTGDEIVWPVFINEQAYYEKHFAMSMTRRRILRWD